jgi:hypothetical protein
MAISRRRHRDLTTSGRGEIFAVIGEPPFAAKLTIRL